MLGGPQTDQTKNGITNKHYYHLEINLSVKTITIIPIWLITSMLLSLSNSRIVHKGFNFDTDIVSSSNLTL